LDKREKPRPSKEDVIYALTKSGVSQIPIVGASAAEILALVVAPPLQKRRDEWIESIGEGLKKLEETVEGFKIEELANNEKFITTVAHASQAAIRTHQKEKLKALRNAVLNAALPNSPEEDLQLMFLSFVDSLTPSHLIILSFFENPKEWGEKHGITYPTHYLAGSPSAALEHAFPEFRGKRELYDVFIKDLFSRSLMRTESIHTTTTATGMFAPLITDLGKQFLKFITSPIENDTKS
jgi:hypothetical protein